MIKDQLNTFYEKRKSFVWLIIFTFLCLLYIDIWNWGKMKPLFYGLPYWIIYHFVLTLFTGLVFYLFTQSMWGED